MRGPVLFELVLTLNAGPCFRYSVLPDDSPYRTICSLRPGTTESLIKLTFKCAQPLRGRGGGGEGCLRKEDVSSLHNDLKRLDCYCICCPSVLVGEGMSATFVEHISLY